MNNDTVYRLIAQKKEYQTKIQCLSNTIRELEKQQKQYQQLIEKTEYNLWNTCPHQWVNGCDSGIDQPREQVCQICGIIR